MNTFLHEHWRGKLNVALALLLLIAATIVSSMTVVRSQGTPRKIVSDDFTNNRPAAASAATPTKGTPGGSTRPKPKPPRTYTLASQPAMKPRPTSGAVIAQLGITIWRLRALAAGETGQRALIREKNASAGWVPERVEAETFFREGDRVRLSVESPRAGYLYVVNRDLFADGTTGGAMLIYPWTGIDNRLQPGRLIDIPAQEDSPGYFTARLTSPNQVGELLTFIITSSPLDLPITNDPFQIATGQMRTWEKTWGGETDRFEMEGGAGEGWTVVEQQASTKKGTRQLTREDPGPQTIYQVSTTDTKAMLVHVRLRYAK